MKPEILIVLVLVPFLLIPSAYGLVAEVKFEDIVRQADLILVGTVKSIEPTYPVGEFGSPKDQFFHDVNLSVEMTLFKDIASSEVMFRIQKERQIGFMTADVSTSQDFEKGERVLVFLQKDSDGYWNGAYNVIGLYQGKYSLRDGNAFGSHFNGITEDELISKIYEVRKKKIPEHTLDENFSISFNQTISVENELYVTFAKLEDSRCPSDVTCVWQGRAAVRLDITSGIYNARQTLSVGGDSKPATVVFDKYKIELVDVKPYPVSDTPKHESEYEITLVVSKSGFVASPLKQVQDGIPPERIECRDGFVLVHKYDGSPACVTLDTKAKLIERGWTHQLPPSKNLGKQSVEITGEMAFQICEILRIPCPTNPVFDATRNPHTEEVKLFYFLGIHRYDFTITGNKVCYTVDGGEERECETLYLELPADGDKSTLLGKSFNEWQSMSRDELRQFYERYGDDFYSELGRFLVKHEMKQLLEEKNIENKNDDFEVFSGAVLTSLPPHIGYKAVVNGTDGNSYLLSGGTLANTVKGVGLKKLIFYHDLTSGIQTDSYDKLQTITILPEDGNNARVSPHTVVLLLEQNNSVKFHNTLSEPIRIQESGSGKVQDEDKLSWKTPLIEPNQTYTISFDKTGHYEWDARLPPEPLGDWWKHHAGGEISVISSETPNLDFREKLQIAGSIIKNSEIPWSSMGMGNNEGLRIGFNQAIFEMLPDAKQYYTARADQLIPFDVPIIIED